MLKQLIFAVMLLISGLSIAQNGTTSPYSFFGIGEQKFKGTAENRSMGGMSVYSDSIHLNFQNPAGVAKLQVVNYTLGGSYKYVSQITDTEKQNATSTNLDYLAFGVPLGKFGASFGILPYSVVGYKIKLESEAVTNQYSGEGGLNKVFLTLAYNFSPEFSFGIDANYNFGNIERKVIITEEGLELGTREVTSSNLLGFSFNIGAIYTTKLNDYLQLTTTATYSPATDFTAQNSRTLSSISISETGNVLPLDFREIPLDDTEITFPSQFTFGAGLGNSKHWFIGAQYINLKTSNFNDPIFNVGTVKFTDANKYRIGGFYIPNYNSLTSYWHRIVYRGGIRYEENGINVRGEDINEFGISFGVGLPIGKFYSNLNIGFEIGSRGTTTNGLVKENFFNTFLSISLNDKWFEKRYID